MKAVVLLSGGMDSTVLLAHVVANGWEPIALSVNYGQRHGIYELHAAVQVAEHYGLISGETHFILDMQEIGRVVMAGSSQTSLNIPVPHGHYTDENMKITVVPNRNMVLLSLAASLAVSQGAGYVCTAVHAGDHAIYPDCRGDFINALEKAVVLATEHKVLLYTPFLYASKANICRTGALVHAPLKLTYSCYEGEFDHCGKCGTCVERKEAFQLAGVPDPTSYRE